jgi:hypothetical protein
MIGARELIVGSGVRVREHVAAAGIVVSEAQTQMRTPIADLRRSLQSSAVGLTIRLVRHDHRNVSADDLCLGPVAGA